MEEAPSRSVDGESWNLKLHAKQAMRAGPFLKRPRQKSFLPPQNNPYIPYTFVTQDVWQPVSRPAFYEILHFTPEVPQTVRAHSILLLSIPDLPPLVYHSVVEILLERLHQAVVMRVKHRGFRFIHDRMPLPHNLNGKGEILISINIFRERRLLPHFPSNC